MAGMDVKLSDVSILEVVQSAKQNEENEITCEKCVVLQGQ